MSSFPSLLVPLDGSRMAARSVGCAVWLAAELEACLHILSATAHPLSAREELSRLRVPESHWPRITLHHAMRFPEDAILGAAEEYDSRLIVMSAHGEAKERAVPADPALDNVGHVTRAVIEHGSRPVLLLPDAYRERLPWKRVLVPLSAEAEVSPAASTAVALANELALSVRIAHVLDEPDGKTGLEAAVRYADAAHYEYPQQLAELVRRAVPTATPDECRCIEEVVLLRGDIGSELLRQIERDDVSLIVIGWHGSLVSGHARVIKSLLSAITRPMLLVKAARQSSSTLKVGARMA
ncbi:MAG TPA: universal stress protein [Steroidobacteraceae bacterium]|jgi:nucleotide-binding universal stress UspA family protein|nr:universal stress protein [Steroidobacteraceae bacterium]